MTDIHPTAVVEKGAELDETVKIGAFAYVGSQVKIGKNTVLLNHSSVVGDTVMGSDCKVFPFAVIGGMGQHKKDMHKDSVDGKLFIGNGNIFREGCTVHVGTDIENNETIIGNEGLFMANTHVAHDCILGDNVILVNNSVLGGHVRMGDWAILGGLSAVHQWCRIGKHAMIGGMTGVGHDVIPFGMVTGNRGNLVGLNIVGLKRRNFTHEQISDLLKAYDYVFSKERTFAERLAEAAELFKDNETVMEMISFMLSDSSRQICQPE